MQFEGIDIDNAQTFGMSLAGHSVRADGVSVTNTEGALSAGVIVRQTSTTALDDFGASVVSLSELLNLELVGNDAEGLVVIGAALLDRTAEKDGEAIQTGAGLVVRGGRIADNGGGGAWFFDSVIRLESVTLEDNAGVGVWLAGVDADVAEVVVSGTELREIGGRIGRLEIGDGVVVDNSERFSTVADANITLTTVEVKGSARYGVLLAGDRFPVPGVMRDMTVVDNASADYVYAGDGAESVDGLDADTASRLESAEVPEPDLDRR
jgi:hypothetical protein